MKARESRGSGPLPNLGITPQHTSGTRADIVRSKGDRAGHARPWRISVGAGPSARGTECDHGLARRRAPYTIRFVDSAVTTTSDVSFGVTLRHAGAPPASRHNRPDSDAGRRCHSKMLIPSSTTGARVVSGKERASRMVTQGIPSHTVDGFPSSIRNRHETIRLLVPA